MANKKPEIIAAKVEFAVHKKDKLGHCTVEILIDNADQIPQDLIDGAASLLLLGFKAFIETAATPEIDELSKIVSKAKSQIKFN